MGTINVAGQEMHSALIYKMIWWTIACAVILFLLLVGPTAVYATEGILESKPFCLSRDQQSIDCFVIGPNNRMYHNWWNGSQWNGWLDRGGYLTSIPFCVSINPNRIDCFAKGANEQLIHGIWKQGNWRGWYDVDQQVIASSPQCAVTAVSNGDIRIHCYIKGIDNHLYNKTFEINPDGVGNWGPWINYGGELHSLPEVVKNPSQHIGVFAKGADDQLLYNHNLFGGWEDLNGNLGSAPDCIAIFSDTKDCFALRKSPLLAVYDWLLHKQYNSNNLPFWSEWEEIMVPLSSPPSCVYLRAPEIDTHGDGNIHCFAKGPQDHMIHIIYHYTWSQSVHDYGNSWSEWHDLGGNLASSPNCITRDASSIDCLAKDKNNQMIHIIFNEGNWSSWQAIENNVIPEQALSFAIDEWDGNCHTGSDDLPWIPHMTHAWLEAMQLNRWRYSWEYHDLVINSKFADPARVTWGRDNTVGTGFVGSGLDAAHAAIIGIHGSSSLEHGWSGNMHSDSGSGCGLNASQMKLGSASGGTLRFLHLISCHSTQWEHLHKWDSAAEGRIHLISGFHGWGISGEAYVDDYLAVGFFGFMFGVGYVWIEQNYHADYWHNDTNDICPIAIGFGESPEEANAALNEKYSDQRADPQPYWKSVIYLTPCDPTGGGPLPE